MEQPIDTDGAIDAILDLDPQILLSKLNERRQLRFQKAEEAKTHPMSHFALSTDEWTELKAHLMDGGGMEDDIALAKTLFQAMFDDNQTVFWPTLIHLAKTRAKITGRMQALPQGGVSWSGIGPT